MGQKSVVLIAPLFLATTVMNKHLETCQPAGNVEFLKKGHNISIHKPSNNVAKKPPSTTHPMIFLAPGNLIHQTTSNIQILFTSFQLSS